jgi:hypothetical protein
LFVGVTRYCFRIDVAGLNNVTWFSLQMEISVSSESKGLHIGSENFKMQKKSNGYGALLIFTRVFGDGD